MRRLDLDTHENLPLNKAPGGLGRACHAHAREVAAVAALLTLLLFLGTLFYVGSTYVAVWMGTRMAAAEVAPPATARGAHGPAERCQVAMRD